MRIIATLMMSAFEPCMTKLTATRSPKPRVWRLEALISGTGRRRPVPEIRARNRATRSLGERLAVNFVMQGSNADIIKVAMIRIHRRLRDEGRSARLVLQVHDELLLEVPDAEVSAVRELVRAEMCGAYDLDPPLAVDVGTGENWAEAKS